MARVTQEHVEARRRQILDSAHRQFGLKGLDPGAATLDDVAEDAGLSKGAIYGYFKNKDALLEAVRADSAEADLLLAREALDEADSARAAFSALFKKVWDRMTDPGNRERNMLSYDYLLHEVRNDAIDPGNVGRPVTGLTMMLEACQKEGSLPVDIDARLLAVTLWNTQQGTRGYYLRTGDRETSLAVLNMIEELLNRLSGPSPGAP